MIHIVPLSSDAFSGWSAHDTERETSEKEVIAATKRIFEVNTKSKILLSEANTYNFVFLASRFAYHPFSPSYLR